MPIESALSSAPTVSTVAETIPTTASTASTSAQESTEVASTAATTASTTTMTTSTAAPPTVAPAISTAISGSSLTPEANTIYPTRKPIIDVNNYGFKLSVRSNEPFNDKLTDKTTDLYKSYEANFTEGLTEAFKGTDGFKEIEVLGFKNGSIICDYNAVFDLLETNENTTKQINTTVVERINNIITLPAPVDKNYTKRQMDDFTNSGEAARFTDPCIDACPTGSTCSRTSNNGLICRDSCDGFNCGKSGTCVLHLGQPKCRCDETSDVIYSGEKCDEEIEKLLLSTNYIIIISCSIFGVTIMITIIIVIVIKRRARLRTKHYEESDQSNLSFESISSYKPTLGEENINESTTDGRMRSDTDAHKNYINQLSDISPSGRSFYEHIDTETTFVIRRPKIKVYGQDNLTSYIKTEI
ncbi:interphotoreceptor matrix proteoglycan 2 [Patella vulgata]|uniref:interphotoreceptor matrix proteoglycan 2 n=1 Tax=Patella vulgata TaxID=6465 RepID=UPI0024A84AC0|nr:interphotoreceptor matrix proteoglycan 2 [Patella vulgata]